MKTVAIVGAGAAGICMGRYLRANRKIMNFVVYEQAKDIGGTWMYDENVPLPKHGSTGLAELRSSTEVHSSMYRSLRTNLPKQLMEYPELSFPEQKKSFVRHWDVLEYLNEYAGMYGLKEHIRFRNRVQHIVPVAAESQRAGKDVRWKVTAATQNGQNVSEDVYDSVVICNGHFAKPDVPDIPGIENFKGSFLHSHQYRVPDTFKDKRVLVLGGSASGRDIAVEISKFAKNVVLSHRSEPGMSELPSNVMEHPAMKSIDKEGTVMLANGESCLVDAIVFCTGYLYELPFLDAKCGIKIKQNRIHPLYKQIFNVQYPSMAFIGVPSIVCPFKLFSMQATWISNVISGKVTLPSVDAMLKDSENEFQEKVKEGIPPKYFHRFDKGTNLEYFDTISKSGKVEPLKKVFKEMFIKVKQEREQDLLNYREKEYVVKNDDEFEILSG